MLMTGGNIVFLGILAAIGVGIAIFFFTDNELLRGIITIIVTVIMCIIVAGATIWGNTHTASGARSLKDWNSDLNNGIERYLAIVADDGMIIYEREGKFDIEAHDNYIVFDENGNRTILYRSYTSTLIIEETDFKSTLEF